MVLAPGSSGEKCDAGDVTVTITTKAFARDVGWSIVSPSDLTSLYAMPYSAYGNNRTYTHCIPLAAGRYQFQASDQVGDGWGGGAFTVSKNEFRLLGPVTVTGSAYSAEFKVPGVVACDDSTIFWCTSTSTSDIGGTTSRKLEKTQGLACNARRGPSPLQESRRMPIPRDANTQQKSRIQS